MKDRCSMLMIGRAPGLPKQCLGEQWHPGPCVFETSMTTTMNAAVNWFPPGLVQQMQGGAVEAAAAMYDTTADPLALPLPPIAKDADWSAKDRQIEWVRTNFTPGMLAKLYKLSHNADGLRLDKCDEIIRKG